MDGYVSEDEILLGFKWSNDWENLSPDSQTGLVSIGSLTGDASTYATAIDANFDGSISSREWLDWNALYSNWLNMTSEEGVTTVNETYLLTFLYRNFDDYSIWNYTTQLFATMDTDDDAAISLAEFMDWQMYQNRFWNEIALS